MNFLLLAFEACYMIKEKKNNEKIILWLQVTILLAEIEKSLFCFVSASFLLEQIIILLIQIEKTLVENSE